MLQYNIINSEQIGLLDLSGAMQARMTHNHEVQVGILPMMSGSKMNANIFNLINSILFYLNC